eukprot:gnl/Dysnectes_brevis/5014_a7021_376.p1 GENE.gnl/Dysnectes_brevis/5014_a7021_376~~gnl/Dysnectes_brevis/5014_a7021_376.p1  ORF type:complete len:442 (+),score=135.42 gnl/Dysnectes_brevis/5014_a7021_376:73-1398(+)
MTSTGLDFGSAEDSVTDSDVFEPSPTSIAIPPTPPRFRRTFARPPRGSIVSGVTLPALTRMSEDHSTPHTPGPTKARISLLRGRAGGETVPDSIITHRRQASRLKIKWDSPPSCVLVIKKPNDPRSDRIFEFTTQWLHSRGIQVVVDPAVASEFPHLRTYDASDLTRLHQTVDIVVTVGGDGTLLHVSSLFSRACPPVLPINCGSMGFLTPFTPHELEAALGAVLRGPFHVTMRTRLESTVWKSGREHQGCFHAMNEVTIDRGYSSYICNLQCYCDGKFFTTVQADGIIISSATGSTAYSMSAGGSPVHPSVPCLLFTPICPHALTARPVVLPDSSIIRIAVPPTARATAWAAFDSRCRLELCRGDSVYIRTSRYPLPTINRVDQSSDWFSSMKRCLHWNERILQVGFGQESSGQKKEQSSGAIGVSESSVPDPFLDENEL